MEQKKVLIIDDETAFLLSAKKVLQGPDLSIDTADNFNEAIKMIDTHEYDIVVTDVRLSGVASTEGMDILRHVREHCPGTKVILLTGYGSPETMEKAYALGASNYLEKPLSGSILKSILQNVGRVTEKISPDEQKTGATSSGPSLSSGEVEYTDTMRKARQVLIHCVRGLDMLSCSTEEEFLPIAENIEDFSVRARGITASAEYIAPTVQDIVILIQFQDITRQQFERSSQACRAMIGRLALADGGKCGGVTRGEAASPVSAEDLVRFCIREARTIEHTREQFVSAVASLIRKLEAIAREVSKKPGNKLAAEIETAVQGIHIHGFADIVVKEVLSNLNDVCTEVGQLVPAEAREGMAARAEKDRACLREDISSKSGDALGDNVELF